MLRQFYSDWKRRLSPTRRREKIPSTVLMKTKPMCTSRPNPQDVFLPENYPIFSISGRIKRFNNISEFFERVNVEQFQLCISKNSKFNQYFQNPVILGQGGFGTVRKITLKTNPKIDIVVKTALLENEDSRAITGLKPRWQTNKDQTTVLNEAKIGFLVNNILLNNQAPFFLFTYNFGFCDSCTVKNTCFLGSGDGPNPIDDNPAEYIPKTFCSNIFIERASLSLEEYLETLKTTSEETVSEKMTSILHQLLIGLHILHFRYQIYHRDIHAKNILILTIPREEGYFKFTIGDDIYYVKNIGVFACIADFGISQSLHPSYCDRNGYLGQRNVEIVGNKMIPLIDPENKNVIIWKPTGDANEILPEISGTRNNIFLDGSYKFDRRVDWTDSLRFPPGQFFLDIQSVFRLIATSLIQIGMTPQKLFNMCRMMYMKQSAVMLLNLNHGNFMLRADLALKRVYLPPKLEKIPVLAEYCVR